jgi:short-subunit dehydrogenase involved in D-alanine esterification of teichoic acids
MSKDLQLTGIAIALDPEEVEIQTKITSPISLDDLATLLDESNTSNIISIELSDGLNFASDLTIPSFDLIETQINSYFNHIIPSYTLTEDDLSEINNTEVLSFELRDYDQRSLVFKIVLEFFNESGGVY